MAKKIHIPLIDAVGVEHPCIIKNSEKAVDMLGGPSAITQSLEYGDQRSLALSFNPQDATSRTIMSYPKSSSNVLLRVSVPKRTGRKRKRGSSEPYVADVHSQPLKKDASYLIRSMADNSIRYSVSAMSSISTMHVWRGMPDYVYSVQGSSFINKVKSNILPQDFQTMKEFTLPRTYGLENTETLPPPVWSIVSVPQNYMYRQNPAVKTNVDPNTGKQVTKNQQAAPKIYSYQVQWDAESYPTGPMPGIPPLETQSAAYQGLVGELRDLFEERPIWTRRAIANCLSDKAPFHLVRFALAYVSYAVRSGPWRDAYVKFGVDPRSDPKYRFYQTVLIQLVPKAPNQDATRETYQRTWKPSRDVTSHIFKSDKPVPSDGKVWQVCDFEDPQLKALANVDELVIRPVCESRYFGWYPNGTNAKMRVALKAKVDAFSLTGRPLPEEALEKFLKLLPDTLDFEVGMGSEIARSRKEDPTAGYLPGNANATRQELEWAAVYRSMARTEAGQLPSYGGSGKGRLSKGKPAFRPSYLANENGSERTVSMNANDEPEESGRTPTNTVSAELEDEIEADREEDFAAEYAEPELGEGDESEQEDADNLEAEDDEIRE